MNYEELSKAYNVLKAENTLLKSENENLRKQLNLQLPAVSDTTDLSSATTTVLPKVHTNSSPEEKITLFMSMFKGREDVYAKRWYSEAKKIKCAPKTISQ